MSLKTLALIGCGCLAACATWFFFIRPAPDAVAEGELPEQLASGRFGLSEEKQRYIWDIEHLSFVLSQDVAPIFKDASRGGDPAPLVALLDPAFAGTVLTGGGSTLTHGPVTVKTWRAGRAPAGTVDRAALVDEMAGWGRTFETIDSVGIHFTGLSPVTLGALDGPWTSRWEIRIAGSRPGGTRAEMLVDCSFDFSRLTETPAKEEGWITAAAVERSWLNTSTSRLMEEITDTTGIRVALFRDNWKRFAPPYEPVTGGAHLLDFDRDGHTDLLITGEPRHYLYRGRGDGKFDQVTEEAGLPVGSRIVGAFVADLDGDGFEDLVMSAVIAGREVETHIFRNSGTGTFEAVWPDQHDLARFVISDHMGVADYDGDGLVDLYVPKGGLPPPGDVGGPRWLGDRTSPEGLLLRNLGNWRFEDVTEAAGLAGESVDTFAIVWLDLEPDGDADLFLANHMGANVLWKNQGDGTFEKVALPRQGFGGFSMGATAGDLDGDGDPDLYVANMYSSAGTRVIANLRPEDYPENALDFIQGFVTGNELYVNDGSGDLTPSGVGAGVANSGWSYGPAVVDLDGDGALDLYAPAGFQSVQRGDPDG